MLDKMYDIAVAEVMSRCANDLQNQVALVGEVSDGIERLQDRALAYVSRSPTFEDADEDVKRQAAKFVVDDLFQLGPIEELLWDPEVSEIMVNSPDQVMVERRGKITLSDVHFFDEEHVQRTIARIVSSDGRRCDNQSPLCDCMLHRTGAPFDGSRVNAVAFGIAKHWTLDVRKFRNDALTPESLIANGSMDENMADFLQALVLARMNIVIEGGTGSGKTTLLNALSNFIPDGQRIITVEDTAELNLAKSHVLSLQSRPANNEGKGEITLQQLVINTLRQRPDRIVVGECRGPEAFDMLQAMNSGHDGSLTTTHANNPRAALDRLQNLVQMSRAGANMPPDAIMKIITEAVDFVVEIKRLPDGSRRVNNICEVCGMQGNVPTVGSIMKFQKTGIDSNGRIKGEFRPTGSRIVSEDHKERFYSNGVEIKSSWFDNGGLW